ncbi:MAG: hypothetical protein ACYSOJ_11605 [Planctomycetota bacterium]|jgi:hypothetical protein
MAFDKTLVRGFTYMNTGNPGFAPGFYTINYNGDSADWVASADLDTYLRANGVCPNDGVLLTCTSGSNLVSLGAFIENGGLLEVQKASLSVIT